MSNTSLTKHAPKASGTMSLFEQVKKLQAQGADIVSMAAGELDADSPASAKEAAIKAINENFTRYTISNGLPELRDAIAAKLSDETGQDFSQQQILVSNGCKQATFNMLAVVVNRGDEVIIPSPYYPSHVRQVELLGADPVFVKTNVLSGSQVDGNDIEKALTPKTRAIIISSPHNPTGAVYTRETLQAIVETAQKHDLWLLSDEIYASIVYPPAERLQILRLFPEMRGRLLLAGGFSKAFAMTGWRVGFAAGPEKVISRAGMIQSNTTTNVCSISQKAALEALRKEPHFADSFLKDLQAKRDFCMEVLGSIAGLKCPVPEGAFYLFPCVEDFFGKSFEGPSMKNSNDISDYLLNEHSVAVVPGAAFGAENHIRLTFAIDRAKLEKGLLRIKKGLEQLE